MLVNQIQSASPYNPYASSGSRAPVSTASAMNTSAYGSDMFNTEFYNINRAATGDSAITKMFIGGLTGYKFMKNPGQNITQFGLSSMGIGAAISGTLSLVKNVASLSYGKQDSSKTVSNVLTDTLQGGISAVGGTIGGWGTNKILTAMGAAAGTPLIIASVIGAAAGAVAINHILNTESMRSKF